MRTKFKISMMMIFIILFSVTKALSQNEKRELRKYVKINSSIFSLGISPNSTILNKEDTLLHIFKSYVLPSTALKSEHLPFDINKDYIYSVSVFDLSPVGTSFWLVKSRIDQLDPHTSNVKNVPFVYGEKSVTDHYAIAPLNIAFKRAKEDNSIYLYYDLLISSDETPIVFILLGNELSIWEYRNKHWIMNLKTKTSLSGKFNTVLINNKKYLFSNDGRVYEIENELKQVGQFLPENNNTFIFDKDRNQVFISDPNSSTKPSESILYRAKKIF